jgi:hypothetical protein
MPSRLAPQAMQCRLVVDQVPSHARHVFTSPAFATASTPPAFCSSLSFLPRLKMKGSQRLRANGQGSRERLSSPWLLSRDRTTMQFDKGPGNSQSQSRLASILDSGIVAAKERVKHVRQLVGRDTGVSILHGQQHALVFSRSDQGDLPPGWYVAQTRQKARLQVRDRHWDAHRWQPGGAVGPCTAA